MKLGIICPYDDAGFEYAKSLGLDFIEICYNIGNDCKKFSEELPELIARTEKYGISSIPTESLSKKSLTTTLFL